MSDTPRCDEAARRLDIRDAPGALAFARMLERELTEANVCESENFRRAEYNLEVRDQYKAELDESRKYAVSLQEAVRDYLHWCERNVDAGPVGNPNTHAAHNERMRAALNLAPSSSALQEKT